MVGKYIDDLEVSIGMGVSHKLDGWFIMENHF